jgi:hypothetical protein
MFKPTKSGNGKMTNVWRNIKAVPIKKATTDALLSRDLFFGGEPRVGDDGTIPCTIMEFRMTTLRATKDTLPETPKQLWIRPTWPNKIACEKDGFQAACALCIGFASCSCYWCKI